MVTGSLTITNVVAIDNHVGFQLAGHFSPGMAPSVLIIDGSTIVARVGQDNSDGDCLPGESRRPTASIGVVPASFVELRRCTEEPPTFAQGGCDPESEGPVLMAAPDAGFMEVRSVSFLNFRSDSSLSVLAGVVDSPNGRRRMESPSLLQGSPTSLSWAK